MLSMRGGRSLKPFAAIAASVVMAIAIPMTSAFADDHQGSGSKPTPKHGAAPKVLTTFVVNTPACQAAITQLKTDLAKDMPEDVAERQAEKLDNEATEAAQEAADKTVDLAEKATLAADRAAIETACEPVPTTTPNPGCSAAQAALKAFNMADKAEDMTERTTTETPGSDVKGKDNPTQTAEDTTENAQLKPLRMAVETACGSDEHSD